MVTYSKNTSTALTNLEFNIYDAVAHFNIGTKASVLIYEKHNFAPQIQGGHGE